MSARVTLLLCLLLTVCACPKRPALDVKALGDSVTLLLVSYQGPTAVRVHVTNPDGAWKSVSGLPLGGVLQAIDDDNTLGVAVLDATAEFSRARFAALLHLLDAGTAPLIGVADQLPEAGAHSIFKLNHHATPPTLLMMREGDTPARLGAVARATGADFAAWAQVTCSIQEQDAAATFSVIMANNVGKRVAFGDGVGSVSATERVRLANEEASSFEDVVVAICQPAIDRAISRIANQFVGRD